MGLPPAATADPVGKPYSLRFMRFGPRSREEAVLSH